MARERISEKPKRTISLELFKMWKASKKHLDLQTIIEKVNENNKDKKNTKLPASHITISKALLYGFCPNDDLRDFITDYFAKKNLKEKELIDKLKNSQ